MSDKNKRVIPDGAHHSGLMKDYGGQYNPEFSERHAEAAESLLRDAVIRADAGDAEIARLTNKRDELREALAEYLDWHETNFMLPSGNFEDPDQQDLARTARNLTANADKETGG